MSDHGAIAHPETELSRPELEHPRIAGRTVVVGARIFAGCLAFYFLAFFFAFVYLKTIDDKSLWHPSHESPSIAFGIVVLLLMLAEAALFVVATQRLVGGQWDAWRLFSRIATLLALVTAILLAIHLFTLSFGYGDSGYTSVFVGWGWSNVLAQLAMIYVIGTLSAQSHRHPPEERLGARDLTSPTAMTPFAQAARTILLLVSGAGVLSFVLLYLVR